MLRVSLVIALLLPVGFSTAPIAADDAGPSRIKLPAREKFHLYLLIGQSNMAGRGKVTDKYRKAPPRVLKLDKNNRWVPATPPLHFDKPIAGLGIGDGFGRKMAAADKSVTIGLIPCAVGGTPLRRWVPGGDLYRKAIVRARIAMKQGTLKGILWHQGESDCREETGAKSYGARLASMIAGFRKELGAPKVPVAVGELGQFLSEKRYPHYKTINKTFNELPGNVANTACVDSDGLKPKRDNVHFDAPSLITFGERYAEAMLKLQTSTREK